jgi:8-oxo-dGTP pyrophosphatase MutT (NUDIX family)
MYESSLVFLLRNRSVLLGRKEYGKSRGKWVGFGGGREDCDADALNTAIREVKEETGLEVIGLQEAGLIKARRPDRELLIHIFVTHDWQGEPVETEEVKAPTWFKFTEVPFDEMWEDARVWLPQILLGKKVKAEVIFGSNMDVRECRMWLDECPS